VQNSLERLCDGIAASLREDVAPAIEDPYARAQVTAAIELLGNLAARVEWRSDLLREEINHVRAVLETAPERPAVLDEPVPAGGGPSSPPATRTSTRCAGRSCRRRSASSLPAGRA
jgi:hypothetical protein